MTTTVSTEAHNAATNAVTALIGADGNLKLRLTGTISSPGTAAATLPLSTDAFGDASNGIATANAITSDTNATGNATAIAAATLEKSDGTAVIHFEVAASGADADITNGTTINAGDTVSCPSLTFRAITP